jgi:hypothetical protein
VAGERAAAAGSTKLVEGAGDGLASSAVSAAAACAALGALSVRPPLCARMWSEATEDAVMDAEAEVAAANVRWFGSVRSPEGQRSGGVAGAEAEEVAGAKYAHLHSGASRFDPPARRASRELLAKPLSPRSPGAAREHVYDLSLTGMVSLGRREDPTIVLVRRGGRAVGVCQSRRGCHAGGEPFD